MKRLFPVSVLAVVAVFATVVGVRGIVSTISIGERGRIAIQTLDEVRRPFLEINATEVALFNNGYNDAVRKRLERGIERGIDLISTFKANAAYNPELLRDVEQLETAFLAWVEDERTMFAIAQGNNYDISETLHEADIISAAGFSRTMSLLGNAEGPVHEDIERGSRAVLELIFLGGAMLAVLLGIAFYVMRNRNRELKRMLAGRQRAEQGILELNKELEIRIEARTKALKEANQLNESILSVSPVGISMYGQDGQCISANDAIGDIIGATREQVLAQNFYEIRSWEESGLCEKAVESLSTGKRLRHEVNVTTSFGKNASFDCHLVPTSINNEQHLLFMISDITENKQIQEQLIQSSKMATLGEMATGVAHELNQPLNVIRMAVHNIKRRSDQNKADPEYLTQKLDKVEKQVERAAAIIDHMRIFGRKPGEGKPQMLDAMKMVNGSLSLIGEQLRLSMIEVAVDGPENCRPFRGHQVQIEQVLLNLLTNARDALRDTTEGGKHIGITVQDSKEAISISIEDSGCGIEPEVLPRIFEPFYTTKEVGQGTGLGLSISYGIITDMGGSITAENIGDGARFVVTLPACEEDTAAA